MTIPDPQTQRILITRTPHRPTAAEVKRFMSRFGVADVPDAAVRQLIAVMSVANRWLKDHPEEAPRLIVDPAAVLEAMQASGALTEPVDDLLAVLRSFRRDSEGKLTARARLVNFLRPSSARFGRKPVLRFASLEDNTADESSDREDR
jgi:hypothetical protein